jgi:hypothetical protein
MMANRLRYARISLNQNRGRVEDAVRDPCHWAQGFTTTYNEHWVEEGRLSPNEPFPRWPYFQPLFDLLRTVPILGLEKSRDLMVSWAIVAYLTWEAMRVPYRTVIFQTLTERKVVELVDYAKQLYTGQPTWLQAAFPLVKPARQQSEIELNFAHGSRIFGLAGGNVNMGDMIRLYHPWGFFSDETAFQPGAGEAYDAVVGAGVKKIILNSSAGPGWFADFKSDSFIDVEEVR